MARKKNSQPSSDQQPAATPDLSEGRFFELLREVESAERQKDQAVALVRTARKRTKEEGGIDLKAFDFVRKHLSGYTEAELIGFGNSIILYAKYLRVPVFQNLQLFPIKEPSEDDKLGQAAARGQVAARRGDSAEQNPWTLDNPLGQEWARAHAETQAQMLQEGIKPLPEDRGTAH